MRHAVNLPAIGPLADPSAVVEIAEAAEEHDFDGLFMWDHVLSPVPEVPDVADTWVILSAVAARTKRIRIGPMVTPLPRRRVGKLARETVTLDHLSGGRLILGLGAGGDRHRELSAFGEPSGDPRSRAAILDDGIDVLRQLWRGEVVHHRNSVVVDGVAMRPGPVHPAGIPIWVGAQRLHRSAIERAARAEGVFPLEATEPQIRRLTELVVSTRGSLDGFDIALAAHPKMPLERLASLGATWAMHSFWPGHSPAQVLRFVTQGPPD